MNAAIQDTLLDLFHQVIEEPDRIPVVPIDSWQEGSGERQLLMGFRDMLECMRQSKRQAEEQLREKEEQYRSIFEASTDALFIIDLEDSRAVEVNPAACQMFGYTREEMLGRPIGISDDSQQFQVHAHDVIRVGGLFQMREITTRKDGTSFYAEVHASPFTYKGKPHMLAIVRDITERVEAEQQLREREEQYRSIFEATNDALFIMDLEDGHIVEANPAACNTYGYLYEEFIGLPPDAFIHSDQLPTFREKGLPLIRAGGQRHIQGVNLRKDGSAFPIDLHQTVFTYQGKPHVLSVIRDITEQLQAEQQLREREEQYRSIFEATYDGLAILDLNGCYVEINPAFCQMFGYTREELIGMHVSTLAPPVSQPNIIEAMGAFKAGRGYQAIGRALRKDGTTFVADAHRTPFIYRGQRHALVVARDITERVEAEQQLREREEQYRGVFEATDDGLIINDLDGFCIEVNPAYYKMLGYTREELIGLHYSQTTYPEYYPVLTESARAIQAGRQYQTQGLARRKDGSPLPVEARATPFTYKGRPRMLGVMRDITERVEAERQLREREEQYRSIFEATSDAVLIRDLEDGHVVEANPAACQMYGYSYEEFIGLAADVITHPDSLRLLPEGLQTVRVGQQLQFQGLGLRKDGTPIHVEVRGTPFTYKGKPHLLGVSRDITERVQAQQLLEQRVEERTRELATLLEVSHNVASTLDLKSLLGLILEQLKVVADYDGATVTIVEGEHLLIIDYRGTGRESMLGWRFSLKQLGLIWETIRRQEVVIVEDVHSDTPLALAYQQAVGDLRNSVFAPTRAWMAIPMMLKERVMGVLNLSSREPNAFTSRHAALALGIANQAAVAIENARLYAQAQELAALEERQKLARELHDSVSQALYGISLGTHAARTALERDPDHVAEPLDYVLSLTEAALAEMRSLIFELRPESLEKEGLVSALTKQAAALQARHELIVSTELCDEPDLPIPVKQELYRIAQEAMHNTVKHARASHVDLRLARTSGGIMLEVRDDGAGFDTSASFPGHLGLHSMRERVTKLGGTFEIESTPGQGTALRANVPVQATAE